MGLIIDGNSVYEVDEECLRRKKINAECKIKEALARQEKDKEKGWEQKKGSH